MRCFCSVSLCAVVTCLPYTLPGASKVTQNRQNNCACSRPSSGSTEHVPAAAVIDDPSLPTCMPGASDHVTAGQTSWYAIGTCFELQAPDAIERCLPASDSQVIYVIGDCHSWINTLPGLKRATSLPVHYIGKNLPHIEKDPLFAKNVSERLRQVLKQNDIVVFTEILTDDVGREPTQSALRAFGDRLKNAASVAAEKSAHMVVMGDAPALLPGQNIVQCKMHPESCQNQEAEVRRIQGGKRGVLNELMASGDGAQIKFFDYMRLLCTEGGVCSHLIPGTDKYALIDGNHLSKDGANYLGPFICDWLAEQNLGSPKLAHEYDP
eukprot:TRINITY_DN34229_c0_g1_i1.p1 TRINITY_DN34229_c0_g1~~TRINITY_DN34229_c0_g1_i1.p1  ORF type:complete len:323 (+),score=42.80 TRINITY_DN34229_c0_g1_i1:69-1037(+)